MTDKVFSKTLLDAFVACKKSKWENESTYAKFKEQANAYLKGKADDSLEHGKLVVELARATMGQFKGDENVKKEKTKKAKATKKLVSRPRKVSQLSGGDGVEAKEEGTQKVAQ